MAGWDKLSGFLKEEVKQRGEEGCCVDGYLERVLAAGEDEKELMAIYNEIYALQVSPDFPYGEPNGLNEIRKDRPESISKLKTDLSDDEWKDKFLGAWQGRIAGCILGKPLECGPYMAGSNGNPGWKNIKFWFEGADAWPISNFTPPRSRAEELYGLSLPKGDKSKLGSINCVESDDDIRYMVIGLIMLEEKGLDWNTWDVGKLWHRKLAYRQVCTAEDQAYHNFIVASSYLNGGISEDWQKKIEWNRTWLNPYREWIGAQIRVDSYAYAAAGNPELAADLAWRDASLSHVKNGIYGAMFISAMISAAFVESDIEKVVEIGLSEIPKSSRLAADIKKAVKIAKETKDQVEMVEKIYESFKHYHPVHTINNAALCAASLVYGQGDFDKTVTTSVLGGWDTDCNGASVGSIMGAMLGASKIQKKWVKPFNDTLYSEVVDFHPIAISECAERCYNIFKKIQKV